MMSSKDKLPNNVKVLTTELHIYKWLRCYVLLLAFFYNKKIFLIKKGKETFIVVCIEIKCLTQNTERDS